MTAPFRLSLPALLTLSAMSTWASAADSALVLDEVEVRAAKPVEGSTAHDAAALAALRPATSDAASLLRGLPGVTLFSAGGVSSLPIMQGMADDRLRTKVDGMDLLSSCPNHMNSPLSYLDASNVASAKVYAGASPVSLGGDSIGGAIVVQSAPAQFAKPGQDMLATGEVGAFYRSNGHAKGANAKVTLAGENLSVTYTGSSAQSDNYTAGGDFKDFSTDSGRTGHDLPADEVGSTAYKARNQSLLVAMKGGGHLLEAALAYQDIPYELYPNQRMDMLGNTAHSLNLHYLGQLGWGSLDARAYRHHVDHYMDFGADKKFTYGAPPGLVAPGMPMYTEGTTDGISVKADINLNPRDLLRLGMDWQKYRLDDWWPPSPDCGVGVCIGGMAPLTFWNINGGERDRGGLFGEWEASWNAQWLTQLGLRFERVKTDTGPVAGYYTSTTPLVGTLPPMMQNGYETSSVGTRADFNNMNRKRRDDNLDVTLLARHTPDADRSFEYGLAQKTRSPNLYERYAWSRHVMALEMINFVGDGNGYLGNPDLKPEVARTLSVAANWQAPDRSWELRIAPYYSRVKDYIDAVQWNRTTNAPAAPAQTGTFVVMKYVNQDARLYGLDLSGRVGLGRNGLGEWDLEGLVNYTRGKNLDTGDGLYNVMPLNATLVLRQRLGGWDNRLELVAATGKDEVSEARNEMHTDGYALVNLRTSYTWKHIRLDFGVENLFDRNYDLPLGGAYLGQGATMSFNRETVPAGGVIAPNGGSQSLWGTPVPGMGRSIYLGVKVAF